MTPRLGRVCSLDGMSWCPKCQRMTVHYKERDTGSRRWIRGCQKCNHVARRWTEPKENDDG